MIDQDTIGTLGSVIFLNACQSEIPGNRRAIYFSGHGIDQDDQDDFSRISDLFGSDPPDTFLEEREQLIGRLSNIQTNLLLNVSQPENLRNVFAIIREHIIRIYNAKTKEEISSIRISIELIENSIQRDIQEQKERVIRGKEAQRSALRMSLFSLAIILAIVFFGPMYGLQSSTNIPIIEVPFAVILWSYIGSFTSILYVFNKSEIELKQPTLWLFTRPIISVIMGITAFYVLKMGFITLSSDVNSLTNTSEILWLGAFIVGFSDTLAEKILCLLVGQFGGDKKDDLVSMNKRLPPETLPAFTTAVLKLSSRQQHHEQKNKSVTESTTTEQNNSHTDSQTSLGEQISDD